jgi:hypothetical protein
LSTVFKNGTSLKDKQYKTNGKNSYTMVYYAALFKKDGVYL